MSLSTRRLLWISFLERIKKKGGVGAINSGKTSSSHPVALLTVQTTWLREGTRQEALSFPSELGLSLSLLGPRGRFGFL